MATLRMRIARAAVAATIRRRLWGRTDEAVAARARRLFGAPRLQQWWSIRRLRVTPVLEPPVRGEWLAPAAPAGTVLYVHGGGYVSCSARVHRPIAAGLARRGPFRVFAADYRLAPEHRFPAALDDVIAAYRWLLRQGLSGRDVALAGDSAGGGLVLSALVRIRDAGLPLPACAVALSPWSDLTGTAPSIRANDGRCAMFRPENMAQFSRAYLAGHAADDPGASPRFARLDGLPPVLLQAAADELLLDDARGMHEALQAAGGRSELRLFEGVFHGWHMLDGFVPEASLALDGAADFIRGHLDRRDPREPRP